MISSSGTCTPRSSHVNSPNVINSPGTDVISASKCKSSDKINRTLLTPCRRVGLKRKSNVNTKQQLFMSLENEIGETSFDESISKVRLVQRSPEIKLPTASENMEICNENYMTHSSGNEEIQSVPNDLLQFNSQITVSPPSENNQNIICDINPQIVYSNVTVNNDYNNLTVQMLATVADNIKKKKDSLKHIKLAKLYEKKHDLQTLQQLTEKWKEGCQKALMELKSLFNEKGFVLSMSQLLSQLQISHDLISFNEEYDDFD